MIETILIVWMIGIVVLTMMYWRFVKCEGTTIIWALTVWPFVLAWMALYWCYQSIKKSHSR